LKPLGTFSHETKAGNILLRADEIPTIYSTVTVGEKTIGKIQDIIGPVTKPYIVIKLNKRLEKKDLIHISKGPFYEKKGRRTQFGKKGGVRRRVPRVQKQKSHKRL